MLTTILYSVSNALVAFIILMAVLRFLGRKEIAQMTIFDLGVAVSMGSITANLAIGSNHTMLNVATILVAFGILAFLTGYFGIKSFSFRKLVNSGPLTMVENGKIIEQNLEKVRLPVERLMQLLREKNAFNIADVEFAIMETDGELSVLPKSQKQPLTPSDLKIATKYKGLTSDLIIDGNIMTDNLESVGLNEGWLMGQLAANGFISPEEVFYAGLDTEGSLYLSPKIKTFGHGGRQGIE